MIDLNDIAKGFGSQQLFEDLNWQIRPGQRIGLIGPNGVGKSTLLKLIMGQIAPDHGSVRLAKNLRLGYLPQEIARIAGRTVREQASEGLAHIWALQAQLNAQEQRLGELRGAALEAALADYAQLQARFEQLGGFTAGQRVESVLFGLGFREDQLHKDCGTLSGGWQMRVAVARLLLEAPDVLLLDEPTNHLDLASLSWLEGFLQSYPGSLIFISHDRWFLNRLASHIAELGTGGVQVYTGNFDDYLEQAAAQAEIQKRRQKNQAREIAQIERFIERFRSKASKARQVQSRVRALEKIDRIELDQDRKHLSFSLPDPPRSGRLVLELNDIHKAYGEHFIYKGLDAQLLRGQRIALVGPNGAGKTTLLRLFGGTLQPDRGLREVGQKVRLYTFAQHQVEVLSPQNTVLQEVALAGEHLKPAQLRALLGNFLFGEREVTKRIEMLSGGEKSRVALVKMLLTPANVLLLDEPTNHLDMESREVLMQALAEYTGTIVLISHDRHFIDGVCEEIWEVDGGRITPFVGNWSDYQRRIAADDRPQPLPLHGQPKVTVTPAAEVQKTVPEAPAHQAKQQRRAAAEWRQRRAKATQKLRQQVEAAEAEVERLEGELQSLHAQQADPAHYQDAELVVEVVRQVSACEAALQAAYARWEEVAAQLEEVEASFEAPPQDA